MEDKNRVKRRKDFTRVYQRGKSIAGNYLVLYRYKTRLNNYRVGFTVSKKVGNAVIRNKIRRRLKEISRLKPDLFRSGQDYIIIARPASARVSYWDLERDLEALLKKINK